MKLNHSLSLALGLLALPALSRAEDPKPVQPGGKLPKPVAIQLVKVADGLVEPVHVACPKDGTGRVFICERPGVVRIVKDGKLLKRPFLDIKDKTVSSFLEQGLYDLEFHPKFKENGLFYIHYSDMWFNGDGFIVEYKVKASNPDQADPESARVVMQLERPYCNHNGGEICFGPDGYLYIGSGDGGWEGDVLNAGQDLSTTLAKVLRIDVNTRTTEKGYGIPKDNPFITPLQQMTLFGISEEAFSKIQPKARPEIWSYGIRNPWTMSFDSKTGEFYIFDIGQNHWEEINVEPAGCKGGINYGWKAMCGSHPFPQILKKNPDGTETSVNPEKWAQIGTLPVAEYSHVDQGNCVIGVGVYRGKDYPSLDGVCFVADWGSGKIWGLQRDEAAKWQMQELLDLDTPLRPTGGGEGEDGALYLCHGTAGYGGKTDPYQEAPGAVWKIVAADKVPAGAEVAPLQKK
jgi:glucose/arabinose dehydrogenase|uniref:PQQ-dependent sugar dehydrogenase n=1 Tax=Prosthecobacter sp. TaxID=1965333 RepID=UPI0037839984